MKIKIIKCFQNIIFKNFEKENNNRNKKIKKLLKEELINNSKLLNSLSENINTVIIKLYQKIQNYRNYNLIGNVNTWCKVIYDFLNYKIKKI